MFSEDRIPQGPNAIALLVGPSKKDVVDMSILIGQIPASLDVTVVLLVVKGEGVEQQSYFRQAVAKHMKRLDIVVNPIEFTFPDGFDPAITPPVYFFKRGKWNYHNMIRFWFRSIFLLPVFSNVEYLMRLDTDVQLPPAFWEVPNFFQFMADRNCAYGYTSVTDDGPYVTQGLEDHVWSYARNHSLALQRGLAMAEHPEYMKMFFNNVELVHLPSFRQPQVQEFIETVDRSYNIYLRRWGDAPLRFALASLFWNDAQVCFFPRAYGHAGLIIFPVSIEEAQSTLHVQRTRNRLTMLLSIILLIIVIVECMRQQTDDRDLVQAREGAEGKEGLVLVDVTVL